METLINIVSVILGIGFLIFIHELGHFLAAKWHGVKVERFSIGFGPAIWETTRGETTYSLCWIPLGGYVLMLNADGASEDEAVLKDPGSFHNKPVSARLAIMSAGVLMNLIFGFLTYVVLYHNGQVKEIPAIIGGVNLEMPAYRAGFRPGDAVIAINGSDRNLGFSRMIYAIGLSGPDEFVKFRIARPGVAEPLTIEVKPEKYPDQKNPLIGVGVPLELTLRRGSIPPLPGFAEALPDQGRDFFREDDRIIAAGPAGETPQAIVGPAHLNAILLENRDRPVTIVVERQTDDKAEPAAKPNPETSSTERVSKTLPPNRRMELGLRMTMGPVINIRRGSPADAAGIQNGDTIVEIDGRTDFDPLRIPDELAKRVGRTVKIVVERPGAAKRIEFNPVVSDDPESSYRGLSLVIEKNVEIAGLGLVYGVIPKIQGVVPGSPAEQAGLKPGEVVVAAEIQDAFDPEAKPETIKLDLRDNRDKETWAALMGYVQFEPPNPVKLTIEGRAEPVALTAAPDPSSHNPYRGLALGQLLQFMPPVPLGESIRQAWFKASDQALSIYYYIVRIAQRRSSATQVGSVYSMYQMGRVSIDQGSAFFIGFLAMLSVNLAVVNLLPIWPLDGGQILLLLGEMVRGRPLPRSWLNSVQSVGLVLVFFLIAWALGLDVFVRLLGWFEE